MTVRAFPVCPAKKTYGHRRDRGRSAEISRTSRGKYHPDHSTDCLRWGAGGEWFGWDSQWRTSNTRAEDGRTQWGTVGENDMVRFSILLTGRCPANSAGRENPQTGLEENGQSDYQTLRNSPLDRNQLSGSLPVILSVRLLSLRRHGCCFSVRNRRASR